MAILAEHHVHQRMATAGGQAWHASATADQLSQRLLRLCGIEAQYTARHAYIDAPIGTKHDPVRTIELVEHALAHVT
jgi:hypothetical protein